MCGGPSQEEIDALSHRFKNGQIAEAHALATSLTARFPTHGFGWKVLGAVHQAQARYEDALLASRQAITLLPDDPAPHNNLGTSLLRLERFDEAEASFRQALAIHPEHSKALGNLGSLLLFRGKPAEAEVFCRRAISLDPQHATPYGSLAVILQEKGDVAGALTCYRTALALRPESPVVHSNYLFCLSHDLQTAPTQLQAEHQTFGKRFEPGLRSTSTPHTNSNDPMRRLRIGFVSGDFYDHAVSPFHLPLFEQLAQQSDLSLHAYCTQLRNDEVTHRLRSCFTHWHTVARLNDAELAEQIRADEIDILIDLSGHTAGNRLLTFARKPAPIQASWLGYLGTTGLQSMDYYLCDSFWLPPDLLDWQLSEKPVFLPCAVVFEPSAKAPPVNTLPAQSNGYVTFGSFNRTNKLNPSVIALWSMLLRKIPSSRMLLGNIPVENQASLLESFAQEGIAPERLLLHPRSTLDDYLALHHQVDLCLDTFPYSGGATNAHAAWMGVPTLCLAGETPASRFGATEMHHLGLDSFIATSIEEFVDKGHYWVEHASELAGIRAQLRSRFSASLLGQAESFASSFASALRAMWLRWCDRLPPTAILIPKVNNHNIG